MKRLFTILVSAVLLLGSAGCVSTPSDPASEARRLDRLALVLKNTVASVVTLASEDRKPETRQKIVAARTAIAAIVPSEDNSADLIAAIGPFVAGAKVEVRIAANAAVNLLDVYYGDYVRNKIGGSENAKRFLTAIVEGIDAGLAISPPVVVP